MRGLLADVPLQPHPLRLGAAQPPALRQVNIFMAPLRIVKFIISTRHLRNLSRAKEAQSDTIMAALVNAGIASCTGVAPPSRMFLIKARARLDVVMMLMRRYALQVRARDIRTSPQ